MSTVYILPNLRKGLSRRISGNDGLRATFDIDVQLKGHGVGMAEDELKVVPGLEGMKSSLTRKFLLAGPVDVRGIDKDAVCQVVPAHKSTGFASGNMPYIEFYEEDLPWKYTPLTSEVKLKPWLLLLACKEGEYKVESDDAGNHRVVIDLDGAAGDSTADELKTFFPGEEIFHKLAHVQVTVSEGEECQDEVKYIKEHPENGISRLFCSRKLADYTQYAMFLVPAFELGRLAGLGESVSEGVGVETLSWTAGTRKQTFPVYYQWTFSTGADSFMTLADKQQFLTDSEMAGLPAGLKADISETGLKAYRLVNQKQSEQAPIDIPAALVKRGKQKRLSCVEPTSMDDELKSLLLKSPVFSDDDPEHPAYEDPWVVPPVYGARHILAKPENLDDDGLFLKELNLRFGNRAVAGMGATVVKKNQEQFMNRAWGMVEEVNALNQRVREFYQVLKANGASDAKVTALRNYEFPTKVFGLQADAAIRIANAQSAADINAVDLANDVTGKDLNAMYSAMGDYHLACGVSVKELKEITDELNWNIEKKEEIVKQGRPYKFYTGLWNTRGEQFTSNVEEKFKFLSFLALYIDAPKISFDYYDNDGVKIRVTPVSKEDIFRFRDDGSTYNYFPNSKGTVFGFNGFRVLYDWFRAALPRPSTKSFDELDDVFEKAKAEYRARWETCPDSNDYEQLFLPVGALFMNSNKVFANGRYMKNEAYRKFFPLYPGGIAIKTLFFPGGNVSTAQERYCFILPEDKFYDFENPTSFIFKYSDPNDEIRQVALTKAEGEKDFKPSLQGPLSFAINDHGLHITDTSPGLLANSFLGRILTQIHNSSPHPSAAMADAMRYKWKLPVEDLEESGLPLYVLCTYGTCVIYLTWEGQILNLRCKTKILAGVHNDLFPEGKYMFPFRNDGYCWNEGGINYIKLGEVLVRLNKIYDQLVEVDKKLWRPNTVLSQTNGAGIPPEVKKFRADEVLGIKDTRMMVDWMEKAYRGVIAQVDQLRETLEEEVKDIGERNKKDEEKLKDLKETVIGKATLVDADQVNRDKLVKLAKDLSKRKLTMDLMESNFDGKYPVMAAPVFPDPTSFYLRELSERYILPSVGELKPNSISCFRTNPAFEEAFLAGMNTEMGRELLWREYPTDERGSCFRKFWDQEFLPDDFREGYFDVRFMHNWKGRLGENHEEGKGSMTVFVVKSELMCQYPQTAVCLSFILKTVSGSEYLEPVLYPAMSGWLADDTYMAGFYTGELGSTQNVYLTFVETDKSQRFTREIIDKSSGRIPDGISSEFAVNRRNDGSVWGAGIDPDYLK